MIQTRLDLAKRAFDSIAEHSTMSISIPKASPHRLEVNEVTIRGRAKAIRRHVLRMAERIGQGYVGQGLGIADLLACLYFGELRFKADDPAWPKRDRFVLSIGHYSIGLYAALAE